VRQVLTLVHQTLLCRGDVGSDGVDRYQCKWLR
jgi:hypothetical protein